MHPDLGPSNYRSVVDAVSYDHLTSTFAGDDCIPDSAGIVTAIANEVTAARDGIFDGSPPVACSWWPEGAGAPEHLPGERAPRVTRRHADRPNPFRPRTAIRFTLARRGPVRLMIDDGAGRVVQRLLEGVMDTGPHEIVWDGTNAAGRAVSSGIYWAQLRASEYESAKKMPFLR